MSEHTQAGAVSKPFAPLLNGASHDPLPRQADPNDTWEPSPTPLAAEAPKPAELFHPGFGKATQAWRYLDAEGGLLFVVGRFEKLVDGKVKKDVTPFCHGRRVWVDTKGVRQDRTGWHMKAPPAPRPLYGLDRLAAQPKAPVLLVEGEKTAEAAAVLFPDHVVVASQGGSKAAGRSDWSTLAGREVTCWPDRDEPGLVYANAAAALARPARGSKAKSFRIVEVPRDWPEGWDLADALPPGASAELLAELLAEAQDADPPHLPPSFTFKDTGLWFDPAAGIEEDLPAERVFICAPFEVVGEANDGAGQNWGLVIRWKDRDSRQHQWSVPKRLIHSDGNRIAEELENAGLHCDPSGRSRNLLKKFIGGVRSKRRRICVERTGWHVANGKNVFILPGGEAYGPAASTVILQTDHAGTDGAFVAAGNLAEWQQGVGRLAVGNHRTALAICIALATPLMDIVGGDSGGFHLVGLSQTGKSTSAFAAGSVWGKGARGAQVRQWRATANGLESAASETSDTVLILDEMGMASGNEVAETVYMLANGSGKQRAGRDGGGRQTRTWRTLFLSTGEVTLGTKMAEAGRKLMAGLEVRLVNLPADAGMGMGVFQTLHGHKTSQELAKAIEHGARTVYGTAGRAFLSHLVRARVTDSKKLETWVKGEQVSFASKHVPAQAAGQVRSVADRFALVGAAGELAIKWGVLNWPKGEAMSAAAACFRIWLGERGGAGSTEDRQAIDQVQAFIMAHGESRFSLVRPDEQPMPDTYMVRDRVGWRVRAGNGGGWLYLIQSSAWPDVCKGLDPKRVARVLAATGLLEADKGGKFSQSIYINRAEGNKRVYVVSDAILNMTD